MKCRRSPGPSAPSTCWQPVRAARWRSWAARSGSDRGRYRLGAGLASLGDAAARGLGVFERFDAVAEALVEQLGESVLLWVREDETLLLAAAREGTHPLRFVP